MYEIKIGLVVKRMLWKTRKNLKQISKETGIPYSTLHTWKENRPPKDVLKAQLLADYFEISLCELLFDKNEDHQKKVEEVFTNEGEEDFFKGKFEIIIRKLGD